MNSTQVLETLIRSLAWTVCIFLCKEAFKFVGVLIANRITNLIKEITETKATVELFDVKLQKVINTLGDVQQIHHVQSETVKRLEKIEAAIKLK